MDNRTLGIIGGVALFLALISPFFIENTDKVMELYNAGEKFRQDNEYMKAVENYNAASKESKKLGKTPDIDSEFSILPISTLINYRIALCYYENGKALNDNIAQYSEARTYIDKIINTTSNNKLRWNLKYLQAMILYRTGKYDIALVKLEELENYSTIYVPDTQWLSEVIFVIGDIHLQQAENLPDEVKRKKCEEAKNYFQKVVHNYPKSDYFKQAENGINKINEIWSKKDEPDPPLPIEEEHAKKILEQADSCRKNRNFITAMKHYDKLIELYPESRFITFAYEGKGEIYNDEGNDIQSLANYEEAIYSTEDHERRAILFNKYQSVFPAPKPIQPDPVDPVIEKYQNAIAHKENEEYLKAAEILEEILKVTEDSYYISLYLRITCDCYYRAYLEDILHFQESIDRLWKLGDEYKDRPFSIYAFQHIIKIYQRESNSDSVMQTIKSVFSHYSQIKNETIEGVLDSWKKYAENNDDDDGGKEENNGIFPPQIDPIEVRLYEEGQKLFTNNRLVEAYKKAEESLEQKNDYKPAIDLKNSILNKYLMDGIKYFDNQEYQKAIDQFQKILNYNQAFAKAHCNLGITYIRLDKFEDAIDSLKKATYHYQEFKQAYLYLGFAYYKLDKYSKALDELDHALSIDPNYEKAKMLKQTIEIRPSQSQ
ncbi:hypothetical protein C6497_14330 [Candidatus Poribacteria bacterium]|nr:MAG: hypothetical protein C6497_14330 [Candidatus Poribacteria bacterium]